MKKIGFIVLCSVLLLCACQENLQDVPLQNRLEGKAKLWTVKALDGGLQTRAVGVKDKFWEKGDTIRIKFLSGGGYSLELENNVKQYSVIWLQYANLHFEFVGENDNADVKIGFDMDDRWLTWSTIGKDCQSIPQNEPSINFYGLADYDDAVDIQGDILRGFGHILGLAFEHQSPDSPIQFNTKAQRLLTTNYGLSQEDVDQLMYFYNSDQTNYSEYDPSSIMVLAIYGTMLTDKSYATPVFNTELSARDIAFIQQLYPLDTPVENVDSLAIININALNEYIASQGEGYLLRMGFNYDGDEKLPFIAFRFRVGGGWLPGGGGQFGYVSHGVIHSRASDWDLPWAMADGQGDCFIFSNELYLINKPAATAEEFKVYSLDSLIEVFYYTGFSETYSLVPYMYNGKRYITGGGKIGKIKGIDEIEERDPNILSIEVYNIDDQQKDTYRVQFPPADDSCYCGMDRVRDGFIECYVGHKAFEPTTAYKLKVGTLDQLIFVASINHSDTFIVVNPNNNSESCILTADYTVFEYRNKLYKANMYNPIVPFYQELTYE